MVWLAAGTLAVLSLAALAGPWLDPFAFDQVNKPDVWAAPLQAGHLLGADALGRDLLARLLIGMRVSLAVGLTATAVSLLIGVSWGAVAGYVGGRVETAMMAVVDVLYALPFIFFVILLMAAFGRSLALMFVAIGAVEWLSMARIVRAQARAIRGQLYIDAARAAGAGPLDIVLRHVLPNLAGPVIAYAALTVPQAILAESFLSFLGLGVQEPLTSLGVLIADGAGEMDVAPWLLVFPAGVMVAALVAFNVLGERLRAALDPRG
jgi:oligopeptide transport system permease protein